MIRGATSSFGQAAVKMAVNAGANVVATTRSRDRDRHAREARSLAGRDRGPTAGGPAGWARQINAVLDLVGNSTILDSLDMLSRGGTACLAGWLGGLDPIADFNPLLRMASGVNLTFFGSFVFGTPGVSAVGRTAAATSPGRLRTVYWMPRPHRCSDSTRFVEAHRVMEAGQAGGKMVVTVP